VKLVTRGGVGLLLTAAACRSAAPAAKPAADTCAARTGELPREATAAALGGEYRLRLVATAGPRAGTSADARLRLAPLPDSLQMAAPVLGIRDTTTRYPLAGSVELDPDAIGAVRTGDLGSTDPMAPGVLVIERRPVAPDVPPSLMLRLGADANRRGVVRFDGGHFALTVRRLDADGFAGTWSSGTGVGGATGYFCAERRKVER
jgi:hypothetical protein